VLSALPVTADPRVLVDYRTADDAGVYALDAERALVHTVDFFTPIVDDPWAYGEIAAANALSDIYAMGGTPISALAVSAFPSQGLEAAVVRDIVAGGRSKLEEAGVVLLGGHTVRDGEIKFGYAVTGIVHPEKIWRNATARAGDALILTKAIGTGIVATAIKSGRAPADVVDAAIRSMRTLNRAAARALQGAPAGTVSACTDVTGFGLIGHAAEMAAASRASLELQVGAVPLLPGVLDLALANQAGGLASNTRDFEGAVQWARPVGAEVQALLFDPQTSGGLLAAVAASRAADIVAELVVNGCEARVVGRVLVDGPPGRLVLA
jgi:selenide,water dikinase